MIAAAIAALVLTSTASPATSSACGGVLDSTSTCASPKREASTIAADAKPEAPPAWQGSIDPAKLPGEFGVAAAVLALGGVGAIAYSMEYAPRSLDDEHAQQYEQIGGASLLVASGLVASAAVALSLFDPATGSFRAKSLYAGAD